MAHPGVGVAAGTNVVMQINLTKPPRGGAFNPISRPLIKKGQIYTRAAVLSICLYVRGLSALNVLRVATLQDVTHIIILVPSVASSPLMMWKIRRLCALKWSLICHCFKVL
ncbi:hypothetical protein J6590_036024 [Homalodisca vitripennis]|nr:hypothetical protein J6590_036024 [Homalodisca vitripennis]